METIKHNGREYRFEIERDDYMGAPWEEHEGHGPVSEWTTRAKLPGELVLCEDRHTKRYYDYAEACRIARHNGWDARPYNAGQETKRQQAAKAARADFEELRKWCADEWWWVGVVVYDRCPLCGEWSVLASLWGIASNCGDDYLEQVARELIEENAEQEAA